LIRDLELVKNILVKDFQNFKDHIISVDEKLESLFSRALFFIKGQIRRQWRTNLNPVFISGKMKTMFYLVDTCGKELAECLGKSIFNVK
jgi:hypothetical protein